MYQAKILLDSVNPSGNRITTFELTYPRFIHSEMMTHRVFSRNAASSRAIPNKKLIELIINDPVQPVFWGANKAGMQAGDEVEDPMEAGKLWNEALTLMLYYSDQLSEIGVHKQLANRLLEPWMYITTIVTATEYDNFFQLRCSAEAQPEIQQIAFLMLDAYTASEPVMRISGQWHIPFIRDDEQDLITIEKVKLSVARCARVSYLTHDGIRDIEKDYKLYDRLSKSGHWSCFEHQAYAVRNSGASGNFKGWIQYGFGFCIHWLSFLVLLPPFPYIDPYYYNPHNHTAQSASSIRRILLGS